MAETARVTGGEHADFTRIVVEAKGIGDWRFGRANDGYELELPPEVTGYDVTAAFHKIPRDRVTALWRAPENGRLRIGLACPCHAIAFEFRAGIVVIDIHSGAPPQGSAFEAPLDPPSPEGGQDPPPPTAGYDWRAAVRAEKAQGPEPGVPLPLPTGEISLDPLRDALLAQISRGSAEGVVDVVETLPKPAAEAPVIAESPWSRVAVGELPGLRVAGERDGLGAMTADGGRCTTDAELDLANWGLDGPVVGQIGPGRSGLLSEFDDPQPEAILRAARLHLHLGFGAEARQILQMLQGHEAQDAAILTALSYLVDQAPLAHSPFAEQEACDTAAALWATLARLPDPLPRHTNADAVARSFASLPPHLRSYLGPPLVDAFLAAGQEEPARVMRDAIQRLPGPSAHEVAMMEARFNLAEGGADRAQAIASAVLAEGGAAGGEAIVTIVEAAFQGSQTLDPAVPALLETYLQEAKATPLEADLLRARVLAAAMAGDYASAFLYLPQAPDTFADLWSMAALNASDEVFLAEAAASAGQRPYVNWVLTEQVARRLLALGFPDLGLKWLGKVDASSDPDLRLLAAASQLALGDATAVLLTLDGLSSTDADGLRAQASQQLGDIEKARQFSLAAGQIETGQRLLTWTQDWPLVEAEGPSNWQGAAALAPPLADPPGGSISRGQAQAEESAAARAVIDNLLQSVAVPG
ncbi:hypothetical protein Q9295_02785 [Xinfangfangia sp. CPCC 101601]|uniref:HEAT repeat domain-containing protein n=1 Tax=Pseudogemmobacter lacusdianii TaxID=3069608 RepID=A0ABU0VUF6_9RHOB|nr:hypothetical protein [Xinfangfangia sp. CPCC 101601]MDQ2065288.1 hypothetical protein [Xinfangfangia sp. CPCC 101601]